MALPRSPLTALLRRAERRLVPGRGRAGDAAARADPAAEPAGPPDPELTVLLLATGTASQRQDCCAALLAQPGPALELLLLVDGPVADEDDTAGAGTEVVDGGALGGEPVGGAAVGGVAVAGAAVGGVAVAGDDRVRRVPASRGAGLAAGLAAARGTFVAVLDPRTSAPAASLTRLVGALQDSGSDLAVGAVQHRRGSRTTGPAWAAAVRKDRPGTTLAAVPEVLLDEELALRVFRRRMLLDQAAAWPQDLAERDLAVTGTVRATALDLLPSVTAVVAAPTPAPRPAAGQALPGLAGRLSALDRTWELVAAAAPPAAARRWQSRVLDEELAEDAAHTVQAAEADQHRLRTAAGRYLALADDEVLDHVRVDRLLRLGLAASGRWDELAHLVEHFSRYGALPPTVVRDGRVLAEIDRLAGVPLSPDDPDLPVRLRTLSTDQTALSGCLESLRWEGSLLVVRGWACIRGVDLAGVVPELAAVLTDARLGSHPVQVRSRPTTAANRWSRFRYHDIAPGGFELRIETADLPQGSPDQPRPRWRLVLSCAARGIERRGPVTAVVGTALGQRMPARDLASADEDTRIVPLLDGEHGFTLQVRGERVRALGLGCSADGGATGRLQVLDPTLPPLVAVTATCGPESRRAELSPGADAPRFDLALPVATGTAREWAVRVVDERGRSHRLSWPVEPAEGRSVGGQPGRALWRRSPRGFCDLLSETVLLEAVTVSVATDALTLDLRLTGLSSGDGGDAADGGEPALADARLSSPLAAVPVAQVLPVSGADGEALTRLVFPLAASRWGQPVAPLPAGDYRVRAGGVDVLVDEELLAGCPVAGRTEAHRYSVGRVAGSTRLLVTLAAPLADDEVGRYAQQQLADGYQAADDPPVEAVLLSCYRGEFATDSQRAVHDQLRAQGSPLRLRWGVSDCSVVLPEGAERLLIGSREWFTALGSSRYLCQNIDFERYLRLRPHQRYLQTFHGYPFKSMGASLWRTQGRYEAVIASEQRRRSSAWSAIVVPEEFCVEFYRREYGFAGEALVTGYPRNDPLVTADARAVSAQVRHRLGIGPDTTVVLYAPTWRDSAATSAWTAELFTGLDLDALAERLGPDHAVLLRGHNYNLRAGSLGGTDRVLDVSDYPEVNDLVLAADVAVLDYSSLRFDWMLTGKPVLFFVPDLEEYLSSRTVLFDFGPTAPGPLLRTTEELAGALLELDVVDARYAAARQEFNERFNRRHDGHATERLVHAFFP